MKYRIVEEERPSQTIYSAEREVDGQWEFVSGTTGLSADESEALLRKILNAAPKSIVKELEF